jgi:hypothetical protein
MASAPQVADVAPAAQKGRRRTGMGNAALRRLAGVPLSVRGKLLVGFGAIVVLLAVVAGTGPARSPPVELAGATAADRATGGDAGPGVAR